MDRMTNWIWTKNWSAQDKDEPILMLFRKKFRIHGMVHQANLSISADTRYKLFLNGRMVEMGPSRGDRQIWFYDEVDLKPYLSQGDQVLAVQVLRYPTEHRKGNHGMFRTEYPGLYLKGFLLDEQGNKTKLSADDSWRCRRDEGFHIISEDDVFAPLQIFEQYTASRELHGWMLAEYDDSDWDSACYYPNMSEAVSPGNLNLRTIPFLYRRRRQFQKVMALRHSAFSCKEWDRLLHEKKLLTIPARTREVVELTAGEEMTGYVHLALSGGTDADIKLMYSESYVQDGDHNGLPIKGHREDRENGHLHGFSDCYCASGAGTSDAPEQYEPFWFRTFRFVRIEIATKEVPLTLHRINYTETGYPLEIHTNVSTSEQRMQDIWDISERTLRRCMHETYEDCPFYEQLQYIMDSRSEILYTYAVSADDRLARKCMDDFRRSQRYDGQMNCSYPNYGPNVIPGFSIYYILMLHDHMMYFGDKTLLEEHLPTVDRILGYFQRNLTPEGYVGVLGGLNGHGPCWSFIDWTPQWDETTGVPTAALKGPITMESLLYIYGLQHAAKIADYLGYQERAERYLSRAEEVQQAVRRYCTGKNGMLQDGPNIDEYSQHVQVFAALTETVGQEQARNHLEETLLHPEVYAQCSVAMALYLFEALRKLDLYIYAQEYWNIWYRMIDLGATTCVEDEVGQRSDCHAWGSLILYELPSVILGVRPAKPGYEAVMIAPEPGHLEYAKGSVITPRGTIMVDWNVHNGGQMHYAVPEGVEIITNERSLKLVGKYYI